MNIQTVHTDTCSMNYIRFGHGEKRFVIIPGLSVQSVLLSAEAIAAAFRSFTEDYTAYLFDRRSEVPEGYSIGDMARDTAQAMKALELKDTHIYAASQGGMISMIIAADYPELAGKLVLASTAAQVTRERYQVPESWVELAKAGRAEDLYMAFGSKVYPADVFENLRSFFSETAKTVTEQDLARFVILAESVKDFSVVDSLERITCPVLVIGSRDDKVFGEAASEQIAEAIPGAELFLYDGYGHAVYDTAPDFTERMLDFFRHCSQ